MSVEDQNSKDQAFVAASQTDQVISAHKASIIRRFIIVPATTSPGEVKFQEGASGTDRILFTGGATSVGDLTPICIEFDGRTVGADFRVTTGANVSVIVIGKFNTI